MTISTVEFIDIIGANAGRAPFVKGGLRAYYATGSQGIAETVAQIAAARAAGMSIVLYDQTPGLSLFAAGIAHVALADVEPGAGTIASVDAAVRTRQAHGEKSGIYCSFDALAGIRGSLSSLAGVSFGVADYSWSYAHAVAMLEANPDWGYVQYGDPNSNPTTLVPGTHVTLAEASADINVGNMAWAAQFMPQPTPPPGGPYRHLTTGSESAADIAARRNEGVHGLLAVAAAHYTSTDLGEAAAKVLPAGIPYYTLNP